MLTTISENEKFLQQIKEDIQIIRNEYISKDKNLEKDEYAFNYWILSKLYSIDEELIKTYITEYNDKSIDCFAYYEENKELYLIQNKYYSDKTLVNRNDVSDFLTTPLNYLVANKYTKSKELQNIFNSIVNDKDAKIFLHFYVTNIKEYTDIKKNIEAFNISKHTDIEATVLAKFYMLNDIYNCYYGKNYKENPNFIYNLKTINKGTFASLREEYGIEGLCEAYYIITPISEIYNMYSEAAKKDYPLFEKNIREYLGIGAKTSVNNGIIKTLNDEDERKNFLYYNNGITITCSAIKKDKQDETKRTLPLVKPQIVNGCQTVNSIVEVLKNYNKEEIKKLFNQVYIMVKALIIPDLSIEENKVFANNVVKYTNRQNAVSDKAFASDNNLFYRMQKEFKTRGFLLLVKPSDKNTFKNIKEEEKKELLSKAKQYANSMGYNLEKTNDLYIPLEKLLQVFLAFKKDGYEAFVRKANVLKKDSITYNTYSTKIQESLSFDNMLKLYMLFKRADFDKSQSSDLRTPIPYYLLGFLNKFLQNYNITYEYFFNVGIDKINETYTYLTGLTNLYKMEYSKKTEYNMMIKQPIDNSILESSIETMKALNQNFPKL